MKWYLSSKTKHKEKIISITKFLESKNEQVLSTWIYVNDDIKPFSKNIEKVSILADKFVNEVLDADILVIFNDREGRDLYTEFGLALAKNHLGQEIKIYIIGDDEASLMQRHPIVRHFKNIKEVFVFENINSENFIFSDF